MAQPRFRFIDGTSSVVPDAQFWRDVEASERLGSRFKANIYLRELCRSRAWDNAAASAGDPTACAALEHQLLRDVMLRGYRLFGTDVADVAETRFADAG